MREMKELPYSRQQKILEQLDKLDQNECVKIDQLAKQLNVSSMTIYRDILQLEKTGEVTRVYGGVRASRKDDTAMKLPPYGDSTIEERFYREIDAKRVIAARAAEYVKDGDVIAIDPSTTTLHMCACLLDRHITVVTTSISVVLQFASSETVDLIMCGGLVRKSALSMVGHPISNTLQQINISKCFFSSHAFTFEQGLTDMTMEEADAKRRLISRSQELFILLDHTKINRCAPFGVCGVREAGTIITDSGVLACPDKMAILEKCREAGTEVIIEPLKPGL